MGLLANLNCRTWRNFRRSLLVRRPFMNYIPKRTRKIEVDRNSGLTCIIQGTDTTCRAPTHEITSTENSSKNELPREASRCVYDEGLAWKTECEGEGGERTQDTRRERLFYRVVGECYRRWLCFESWGRPTVLYERVPARRIQAPLSILLIRWSVQYDLVVSFRKRATYIPMYWSCSYDYEYDVVVIIPKV